MPAPSRTGFCKLEDGPEEVNIYYEIHGEEQQDPREPAAEKVLLIMGLACTNSAWRFQVEELTHRAAEATASPLGNRALVMCTFDNRGIGRSSVPTHKSRYTTKIMAEDALVLMDHLGWKSAHIVGFSMGGMIATKLAAMAPHRVLSLCNIAVSGGGWQSLPQNWKAFKYAVRALRATTPHQRAAVDLKFHFTSRSLKQHVHSYGRSRLELLVEEYVESSKRNGQQPKEGLNGHMAACWTHRVTSKDVHSITGGNFPIMFIHGRHDVLAELKYAEALAHRLRAQLTVLDGAHFVTRECAHEVNLLLRTLINGHIPHREELDRTHHMEPSYMTEQLLPQMRTGLVLGELRGAADNGLSQESPTPATALMQAVQA